jgi:carboxyl-terminal processing protease
MKSKPIIIITSVIVAIVLLAGTCSAGFIAGQAYKNVVGNFQLHLPGLSTPQGTTSQPGTPQNVSSLFVPFWQTWQVVHEQYVTQPVNDQALMRGAINGMLAALGDEHTFYMEPSLFITTTQQLEGQEYEGIGAWVDTTKDFLTIISPMPGSPADKAGLKPGDKVIGIDGESMKGIDGESVRQRILGPQGSTVRLTIQRAEVDPFDVSIVREKILVPTVQSKMLENQIAYVRLFVFGADTADDLQKALQELMAQNPKGLILDLRYNGGGYLDTAIEVASQFIGSGVIAYEVYGDGTRDTKEAMTGGLATDVPMVVLINEGSASASEIVAGAIQDRGRGKLVGVASFGKGSVQTRVPLENDGGAVSVTIAHWLTPSSRQINGVGLTPDYVVEISDADANAGKDPQLQKAIDLLSGQSTSLLQLIDFWIN